MRMLREFLMITNVENTAKSAVRSIAEVKSISLGVFSVFKLV